jgi:preprotein translocase subunit SecE
VTGFMQELLRVGLYKRSQGRITRQVTFAALAVTVLLGLWRLSETLRNSYSDAGYGPLLYWLLPGTLLLAGWWICYRAVNLPSFADFLIAVEAEMNKVSWPNRGELFRASLVVLLTILLMGFVLAAFDLGWIWLFTNVLHILPKAPAAPPPVVPSPGADALSGLTGWFDVSVLRYLGNLLGRPMA